ncbi:MAG: 50S ribosomal protein L10 [Candidatus Limnocylindrales bacterium]
MPTEAKQAAVAELVELFRATDTAIVSDHRGLSVADLLKVRRELRDKGIQYRVIKNRLAKIAAEQADRSELVPLLTGPSAIAIGGADESTLAKGLLDATKPFDVEIRGAALNGQTVDVAAVKALAALPGREQLLAELAGGMAAPMSAMASLLAAPLRDFAYGLAALHEQREAAGSA